MSTSPCLHVVLYQPEIPQNTGSIGRTCVAIGAKLWLVRPLGFRLDDRYLRRAGLDYWQYLDWEVVDDWPTLVTRLGPTRYWYLSKKANRSYTTVEYQRGDALVLGTEACGLPASLLAENKDHALRIPLREQVRSLNLSCAAAVVMYEAIRQWTVAGGSPLPDKPVG